MTIQEPVYRYRVFRVWNIPERPELHGQKSLVFSSRDLGNAEEHALWMREYQSKTGALGGDKFIVEDSGQDIFYIDREVY